METVILNLYKKHHSGKENAIRGEMNKGRNQEPLGSGGLYHLESVVMAAPAKTRRKK